MMPDVSPFPSCTATRSLRIAAISTTRADYGIYRPLLRALRTAGHRVIVVAGGTHPVARFGGTLDEVRVDGWDGVEVVSHYVEADRAVDLAASASGALHGFAAALARIAVDLVFVLGDRYEMLAAGYAASLLKVPLAHLHGGDITAGSYDDGFRHALTKLSHLHFPALQEHGRRIQAMGEEAWRICVCGALAVDELVRFVAPPRAELMAEAGLDPDRPVLMLALHPETLSDRGAADAFDAVGAGVEDFAGQIVVIGSNADEGHLALAERQRRWAAARPGTRFVPTLPQHRFWGWMAQAVALVGNSSSGILEAPSLRLPVVNVGDRQKGRLRAANVIDVACGARAIRQALARATSADFRRSLDGMTNPYGDGRAAERIVAFLSRLPEREVLVHKVWPAD